MSPRWRNRRGETNCATTDDRDAAGSSQAGSFRPAAPCESPRALPVRGVLPTPLVVQHIGTRSSTAANSSSSETTSPSSASELSSELASEQPTNNSHVARTTRRPTSSSGRSFSSRDVPLPSELSVDSDTNDVEEAWPGWNARDLSSPLKFNKIDRHLPEGLPIDASDALAKMQPGETVNAIYRPVNVLVWLIWFSWLDQLIMVGNGSDPIRV